MAYDIEQVKTVYDELTAKVKADLDEQFNKGRLKGTDYANVYSNLMNTVVQLAFESPLKEAQVKQTDAQTELINSQKIQTEEQTKLIKEQENTEKAKQLQLEIQTALIGSQKEQTDAQTNEINARKTLIEKQISDQEYVTQYIRTEEYNNLKKDAELKVSQTNEINARTDLTQKQTLDQEYITSNIRPTEKDLNISKKQEIEEQKNTQVKQQELLERQTRGFDDNFRFKLFDSQMNAWAMMFSSGMLESKPTIITNDELSSLYNDIRTNIG